MLQGKLLLALELVQVVRAALSEVFFFPDYAMTWFHVGSDVQISLLVESLLVHTLKNVVLVKFSSWLLRIYIR